MKRSIGWAWKVKAVFCSLTQKKVGSNNGAAGSPQFASWIPNVPYLEIVETHSGIEIYRGDGKFWVKGQTLSTLIKARRLAMAISNNAEWITNGTRPQKRPPD